MAACSFAKPQPGPPRPGTARITFRLVESQCIDSKVHQHTLLNLGRHFAIDHDDRPLLSRRAEELLYCAAR